MRHMQPGAPGWGGEYAQLSRRPAVPGVVDPHAAPVINMDRPIPGIVDYVPGIVDYEAIDSADPTYMTFGDDKTVGNATAVGDAYAKLPPTSAAADAGASSLDGDYAQLSARPVAPGADDPHAAAPVVNTDRHIPGIVDYEAIDDADPTYMTFEDAVGHENATAPGLTAGFGAFYAALSSGSPTTACSTGSLEVHGHDHGAYDSGEYSDADQQPSALAQPPGNDGYQVPEQVTTDYDVPAALASPPPPPTDQPIVRQDTVWDNPEDDTPGRDTVVDNSDRRETVWEKPNRADNSDPSSVRGHQMPVGVAADGSEQSGWPLVGSLRRFSKRISRRDGKDLHTPTSLDAPVKRQSVFSEANEEDSAVQVPAGDDAPVLPRHNALTEIEGRTVQRDSVGRLRMTPVYDEVPTFQSSALARRQSPMSRSHSYESICDEDCWTDKRSGRIDPALQPAYEVVTPTSQRSPASPDAHFGLPPSRTVSYEEVAGNSWAEEHNTAITPIRQRPAYEVVAPMALSIQKDAVEARAMAANETVTALVADSPGAPAYTTRALAFDGSDTDYTYHAREPDYGDQQFASALVSPSNAQSGQNSARTQLQDTQAPASTPRPRLFNPQNEAPQYETADDGQPIYTDVDTSANQPIYNNPAALTAGD